MPEHRIDYIRLADLKPARRNPKAHDAEGIRRSLERLGYGESALLDERTGLLVAGHGRLEQLTALRDSGQSPPDGVLVDDAGEWMMPVERGWASRSDADAEGYLIADNRWTERGGWEDQALADMLENMARVDGTLLEHAGYSEQDMDDLVAVLAVPQDMPGDDHGDGPCGTGEPDGFMPTIIMRVPTDLFERWRSALDYHAGADDVTKLTALLTEVEAHRDHCPPSGVGLVLSARFHGAT